MKQNVQHIVCYSNIGNIRHELFAIGNNSLHQKQKKKTISSIQPGMQSNKYGSQHTQ
jgi:hypothetical protein